MAGTRKSHFLSRFFLGGFTLSGKREDQFWVFSKAQQRSWPTRAENAGFQHDLFRMSGPQFGADDLEKAFASVEHHIAPVLREVVQKRSLPSEPVAMSLLLHLPALNAARPPGEIKTLADLTDFFLRSLIAGELTPELHARILSDWNAAGKDVSNISDLEALKKRNASGGVRAELDRNYLLTYVLGRATLLVELLHQRRWALLTSDQQTGFFVCSDRPVSLLNNQNLDRDIQPRFDDPRFDVIMPLSKELCLIGHFLDRDGVGRANVETVGFVNRITEAGATDMIYSPTKTYYIEKDDDASRRYGADVLRAAS
ncbi:MAG: DUF4238 domain-containing protein [Longimicrobiaceae bacterium]